MAYLLTDELEVAVKYEGVMTSGIFFLKSNMAGPSPTAFFENTSLAFEYLHGEFENDNERDQFTPPARGRVLI